MGSVGRGIGAPLGSILPALWLGEVPLPDRKKFENRRRKKAFILDEIRVDI